MRKINVLFSVFAMSLCFALQPMNTKAADTTAEVTPTVTSGEETAPVSTIQPFSLITGEEDTTNIPYYDIVVPLATKSVVVPIQMDYKGQLNINFIGKDASKGVDINLYSDEACTTKVGYTCYLSSSSLNEDMKYDMPEKATYYLKLEMSKYAETDATVKITPYSFSSEGRTLKEKVWIGSHPFSSSDLTSHKIVINKPGYIKIEGASLADWNSIYATLYNSKKEALSKEKYLYGTNKYTTYYAVKKGTYYITIKASDDYKLRYSFTAVKDVGGQSMKKATVIGKGKTVKGLILSEDSTKKVDWYKVKLTKSQKFNLSVSAKSNDSIYFEIVPASGVIFFSTVSVYEDNSRTIESQGNWPAGTYYIKVTKSDTTSSGYYSMKLK